MKIIIIGGGASGLMAAYYASKNKNCEVILLEKNEKLGKKIYITGKGRCNVCNACENDEFLKHVLRNPKFLYPSLSDFDPFKLIDLFESLGCPIVVERGRRAFPKSYKASDITKALQTAIEKQGVKIKYNSEVVDILQNNGKIHSVMLSSGEELPCNALILATGGLSYKSTGSTGDGYKFLEKFGHNIKPCSPALVPMNSSATWIKSLMGISLKNVELTLKEGKKTLYTELGEMLFTHFGISGPLVLSASSYINNIKNSRIFINLKPGLNYEKLENRILRDIESSPNKSIASLLQGLYPQRLAEVMANICNIDGNKKCNSLSKQERRLIIENTLSFEIPISSLRDFSEAVITRGGADCKEFVPQTLESKLVKGLYVSGELLDIDALTGGYNLFVAFATGRRAGISASSINEVEV